jgi:hypothetical protein
MVNKKYPLAASTSLRHFAAGIAATGLESGTRQAGPVSVQNQGLLTLTPLRAAEQ